MPEPVDGAAVPDLGKLLGDDGPWKPISIVDDLIEFPERWLDRCSAPPGGRSVDFDDRPIGDTDFFLTPRSESPAAWMYGWYLNEPPPHSFRIVAPRHGTWSAPHALSVSLPDGRGATGVNSLNFTGSEFTDFASEFTTFRGEWLYVRGVTFFGMRVGLATDHDAPVIVELSGVEPPRVGAPNSVIDLDRVVLGPKRTPATSCLIVAAPPGTNMSDVRLRAFTADGEGAEVLIDSVFWDRDQAFPVETPSEIPVEITSPSDGDRLTASRTRTVFGRVTWPSVRDMPSVAVAVPTWDRSGIIVRRAEVGRAVDDGLNSSATFWVTDVRIPSGPFEIHATATASYGRGSDFVSLEGVGPPAPPPNQYRELLNGEVDIVPWALEVTQAVRGPLEVQSPGSIVDDNFDHVADKKTVVRGYGLHRYDNDDIRVAAGTISADAVLHATRGGVTLPLSPLHPSNPSVPLKVLEPGTEAEALLRPSTALTWNFELPIEWTRGAPIELRLEVNPETSPLHIVEVDGAGGTSNTIGRRVSFRQVGRVGISALNVELFWRCTAEMTTARSGPCVGRMVEQTVSSVLDPAALIETARDLWRMWPAPGSFPDYLNIAPIALPHAPDTDHVAIAPSRRRTVWSLSWSDWRDAYHDLCCDESVIPDIIRTPSTRDILWMTNPFWAPLPFGGRAWMGYRGAFISNSNPSTVAQEAGHGYGLLHTSGAHGERRGGEAILRFAGDHGQLGSPDRPEWGFDTARGVVINPRAGEGGHIHDFMSYGEAPKWVSVGVWNHVVKSLANNRDYDDSRGRVLSTRDRSSRASASPSVDGEDPNSGSAMPSEKWLFVGMIAEDGTVSLGAPQLVDSGAVQLLPGSEVVVSLLDAAGTVIERVEVDSRMMHTHGGSEGRSFQVLVPPSPAARTLVVEVEDGQRTEVTGEAGDLTLLSAERRDRTLSVSWEGGVPGSDVVLEVRREGEGWWPIARSGQSSIDIDLTDMPFAGSDWQLRAQTSNGVAVLSDEIEVDLGQPAPKATIASPAPGERVEAGMVEVAAMVGTIGDADAVYTWLVDGQAVTEGPVASVPMLPGTRSLTLRVEVGETTAESTIDVESLVDTDGDGMSDEWEDRFGFDPDAFDDPSADEDGDGLQDGLEYALGADPTRADSDDDGYSDGEEHAAGSDVLDPYSIPGPQHGLDDHDHSSHDHGPGLALWLGLGGALLVAVVGGGVLTRRFLRMRVRSR
ncbi:MAG: thrombospondin type 3 repeat-containing protein [Actinomycetota bacterium]